MIKIRGLHKYFNKGRQNEIHVINGVDLELPEKGMVAIFGKSGCGKTTLLNVIGGLDGFAEGTLTVEGEDIRKNGDLLRNKYMGYIFQNYNLNKSESCFDNVADALRLCGIADEAMIEERVMAALANVGMDKYQARTPDTLSGGQQQRIAIARAIVKNPKIILADEPTGNLDEANTVMIMDLLKSIARDHLVLLVTHEADLVDYYCDMVIELADGRIVGVKNNERASGLSVRDKNHIYLGELERSELWDANASIEYYGDTPAEPISLRIVNNGGKLYVQINTPKVQVLDDFSEIKLKEGVYEKGAQRNTLSEGIDMSRLPPIEGSRFGTLFSFRSSVKSGYGANFKKRKLGKKILRRCMCMFAAVVVFMSAVFGTAFADIIEAKGAYNHNVFYVYTSDADVSERLNAAVGSADSGIDSVRLSNTIPRGDSQIKFYTGFFETFESGPYGDSFRTNAVFLDVSITEELELVAGRRDGLALEEMLISTKVADALLDGSSLGYISEYDDLIGLITNSGYVDGKNLRIAGVIKSDETAVYLTELALAKYAMRGSSLYVSLGRDYGMDIAEGEAALAIRTDGMTDVKYPSVGDTVKIRGRSLKIARIMKYQSSYDGWLKQNGISKSEHEEYLKEIITRDTPSIAPLSPEYYDIYDQRYCEYFDYYYSEFDRYLADRYFFTGGNDNIEVWLAAEKDIEAVKYNLMSEEAYAAYMYKKENGSYPTPSKLRNYINHLMSTDKTVKQYISLYEEEYYNRYFYGMDYNNTYIVSDADYIAFSKALGETHDSAKPTDYFYKEYYDIEYDYVYATSMSISSSDVMVEVDGGTYYTVIHSTAPDKTEKYLAREFSDIKTSSEYLPAILTPDGVFEGIVENNAKQIITGLITMAVILVIMSVCMYFIMRSSLMNRIKEVGIYRAIGVSKRNLMFKFLIEAAVLTTLTVFIGYLLTSAFIFACLALSPFVAEIFYYPMWLAGILLVILYALCLLCGTLPVRSLLKKTPSQILAKYDI